MMENHYKTFITNQSYSISNIYTYLKVLKLLVVSAPEQFK